MNIELIQKEEMIKSHGTFNDPTYREKILPNIEEFKRLIGDGNGKTEIRMRDIRNIIGYEKYKDKSDNNLYLKMQDILREFGINVQMRHHYGCNLVLTLVGDNSEIIKESEAIRIRNDKVAKGAGYLDYADYCRNKISYRKIRNTDMRFDEDNKFHMMYVGKKYMAPELFPGAIINNRSTGCRFNLQGGYDWEVNGVKVKHLACHIRHSTGGKGFERDYFQWNIGRNEEAGIFLLTGWGNVGSLDLMKAWIVDAKEIVNKREFWDRTSFLISTHDRSIGKYLKFEVDEVRLDQIREILENAKQFDVYSGLIDDNEEEGKEEDSFRLEIKKWYDTYFR